MQLQACRGLHRRPRGRVAATHPLAKIIETGSDPHTIEPKERVLKMADGRFVTGPVRHRFPGETVPSPDAFRCGRSCIGATPAERSVASSITGFVDALIEDLRTEVPGLRDTLPHRYAPWDPSNSWPRVGTNTSACGRPRRSRRPFRWSPDPVGSVEPVLPDRLLGGCLRRVLPRHPDEQAAADCSTCSRP